MYKFSANLGLLWTELSQIEAIYKAKEKGFDAVEFQFPYKYDCKEMVLFVHSKKYYSVDIVYNNNIVHPQLISASLVLILFFVSFSKTL